MLTLNFYLFLQTIFEWCPSPVFECPSSVIWQQGSNLMTMLAATLTKADAINKVFIFKFNLLGEKQHVNVIIGQKVYDLSACETHCSCFFQSEKWFKL